MPFTAGGARPQWRNGPPGPFQDDEIARHRARGHLKAGSQLQQRWSVASAFQERFELQQLLERTVAASVDAHRANPIFVMASTVAMPRPFKKHRSRLVSMNPLVMRSTRDGPTVKTMPAHEKQVSGAPAATCGRTVSSVRVAPHRVQYSVRTMVQPTPVGPGATKSASPWPVRRLTDPLHTTS